MALTSREIYWSAILADFRRSGLTHVGFCRLRRISLYSFRKQSRNGDAARIKN